MMLKGKLSCVLLCTVNVDIFMVILLFFQILYHIVLVSCVDKIVFFFFPLLLLMIKLYQYQQSDLTAVT